MCCHPDASGYGHCARNAQREGIPEVREEICVNYVPETCVVGYNRFDDEFVRYGLYRHLFIRGNGKTVARAGTF